jgi:hypothetical protein
MNLSSNDRSRCLRWFPAIQHPLSLSSSSQLRKMEEGEPRMLQVLCLEHVLRRMFSPGIQDVSPGVSIYLQAWAL